MEFGIGYRDLMAWSAEEHNKKFNTQYDPNDMINVDINSMSSDDERRYHYDMRCSYCFMGKNHTWFEHDQELQEEEDIQSHE